MNNENHSITATKDSDSAKRLARLLEQVRARKMELGEWDKRYDERLSHEMTLFKEKGYEDTCLILHDICNLGNDPQSSTADALSGTLSLNTKVRKYENSLCTHAEAGSLVFYLLGITHVDPVTYGLVFEHFLYAQGSATPSITLDTPSVLGESVRQYLQQNLPDKKIHALNFPELDALAACYEAIEAHHGVELNPNRIPLEQEVFQNIYATGKTQGVFEFGTDRGADILRKLQADSMEDVILAYALMRRTVNDPIDWIAKAKQTGIWETSCLTEIPQLEDILKPTYGFVIYQEQVLQMIHRLAGYPLDAAQRMWKNFSRKRIQALEQERVLFLHGDETRGICGCAGNGIDLKKAEMLFDYLQTITAHTVSKSHAAARCMLSYQTAWLKYHYGPEFEEFVSKVQSQFDPKIHPIDDMTSR